MDEFMRRLRVAVSRKLFKMSLQVHPHSSMVAFVATMPTEITSEELNMCKDRMNEVFDSTRNHVYRRVESQKQFHTLF
jgi:hypothetical protein